MTDDPKPKAPVREWLMKILPDGSLSSVFPPHNAGNFISVVERSALTAAEARIEELTRIINLSDWERTAVEYFNKGLALEARIKELEKGDGEYITELKQSECFLKARIKELEALLDGNEMKKDNVALNRRCNQLKEQNAILVSALERISKARSDDIKKVYREIAREALSKIEGNG